MVILSYIAKAGIHALLMLRACGVHGSNKALLARACLYNKCPEAKKHFHLLATPTCYDRVFRRHLLAGLWAWTGWPAAAGLCSGKKIRPTMECEERHCLRYVPICLLNSNFQNACYDQITMLGKRWQVSCSSRHKRFWSLSVTPQSLEATNHVTSG